MAGKSITINSSLQCPHGGMVQIVTTNTRAMADSGFIATIADTFIISGCPLSSPCVTVQWIVPDISVKVNGNPTISQSSVGLCLSAAQLPRGPVIIVNTQQKMSSL